MTLDDILESEDFKHWFSNVQDICYQNDCVADENELEPADFLEHFLSECDPRMAVTDLLGI